MYSKLSSAYISNSNGVWTCIKRECVQPTELKSGSTIYDSIDNCLPKCLKCVHGQADDNNNCICDEGFSGTNCEIDNRVNSGDLIHLSFIDQTGKRLWSVACSWAKNKKPGRDSVLTITNSKNRGPIMYGDDSIKLIKVDGTNYVISASANRHNTNPGSNSVFRIVKAGGAVGVINDGDVINLICEKTGDVIVGSNLQIYGDTDFSHFTITKN